MHVLRSITAVLLAAIGITVFAAQANANVQVELSEGPSSSAPATLVAGGHPDLALRMSFPDFNSESVRNVDVDLPAGMIGNPAATRVCTITEVNSDDGCPKETQIGTVAVNAKVVLPEDKLGLLATIGNLILPEQVIQGKLFNMEPAELFDNKTPNDHSDDRYIKSRTGRPAAIAARLVSDLNQPPLLEVDPITTVANWKLRAPGDYGLTNELRDMPNSTILDGALIRLINGGEALNAGVRLRSLKYTFWGQNDGSPERSHMQVPYTINPVECTEQKFKARAAGWNGDAFDFGADGEFPFTPTGCESLPFDAEQTVKPFGPGDEEYQAGDSTEFQAGQPTGVTVELTMPGPDTGPQQSMVSKATVLMPEGIALSAGVGSGDANLSDCTDAQFGYLPGKNPAFSDKAPTCPTGSKIGTVSFDSPLVGRLDGTVYLGTPTKEAKLRSLIIVSKPEKGLNIKLLGKTVPDPKTGQLTTIFDDLPRQPFTSFKLNFRSGLRSVLKAPDGCTAPGQEFKAPGYLESFNGKKLTLESGITVGGCKPRTFAPTLAINANPIDAGADTVFTTTITRSDTDDRLDRQEVSLPAGLLGRIAGVKACPIADARAGNCADESQIGDAQTKAGTGPEAGLAELAGPVYLTEPFDGGVAGLAIIVPAKVGPVDLGKVVVIGKMAARKDVGIDLTIESTPSIQEGVPLYLRQLALRLYKPGFMFNASSCAEQQVVANHTSLNGAKYTVTAPYQPTNCDKLIFDPQMTAKVTGNKKNPGFLTVISGETKGHSTLRDTELKLPAALGVGIKALQRACTKADYDAGNCKADSIVGTAKAESDLIPLPLTGNINLITIPGQQLPALAVKLQGLINLDLLLQNNVFNDGSGNRLSTTIAGVPDTPINRFELNLVPNAMLEGADELCSAAQKADGKFTGTNGAVSEKQVTVDTSEVCGVQDVGPVSARGSLSGAGKGRTASLVARVSGKNRKFTSLRVGFPSSKLKINSKKLKGNARGVVGGKFTSKSRKLATSKSGSSSFVTVRSSNVSGKSGGASSIELRIGKGALRKAKIKPGDKVKLALRYTEAGSSKTKTLNITVTAKK